jgi:hypothetical protein
MKITKICKRCGASFEGYHNSKYCGAKCRNGSWADKLQALKAERQLQHPGLSWNLSWRD